MGYRNISKQSLTINELAKICGLFSGGTDVNGGYGCRSRSKQKAEPGKCYSWDCPLAYEPDDYYKNNEDGIVEQYREVC